MHASERRLAALERQLKAASGLDARAASLLALEAYHEHGDVAAAMPPPPDVATAPELLSVYRAMVGMLWRSEPNKWWDPEPLPLSAGGTLDGA